MEDQKPKVKILIPVWGSNYITKLLRFLLPSLMAPMNLPNFCKHCNTEVIFLTREIDGLFLAEQAVCKDIGKIAKISCISIDDLLVDNALYGYILSYAYMRGIKTAKADLDVYAILLVADYILSENAFTSLLAYIQKKYSVVLSGSLRVSQESGEALIDNALYRQGNVLKIASRDAVRIALQNLHPTIISKIVNQSFSFSRNYQHFYWTIDQNTLFSHCFMPHPLCLKITHFVSDITGFCDYSFIPELCGTEKVGYLNDSDQFMALELQERVHELGFSCFEKMNIKKIAESLSQWTTKEHRIFSLQLFVYHTQGIPSNMGLASKEAKAFVKGIHEQLSEVPQYHLNHPHWHSNIDKFLKLKKEREEQQCDVRNGKKILYEALIPKKMTNNYQNKRCVKSMIKNMLKKLLCGYPLKIPIWNSRWQDLSAIQSVLCDFLKRYKSPLFVLGEDAIIEYYLTANPHIRYFKVRDLKEKRYAVNYFLETSKFDGLFLFLNDEEINSLTLYLNKLKPVLQKTALIYAHMMRSNYEKPLYLVDYIDKMFDLHFRVVDFIVIRDDIHRLRLKMIHHKLPMQLISIVIMLLNLFGSKRESTCDGSSASSFLLTIQSDVVKCDQESYNANLNSFLEYAN